MNEMSVLGLGFVPGYATSIIYKEITGLYGQSLLKEFAHIIKYYEIYEEGAEFTTEGSNGDYTPSNLHIKNAASLVDKQARFLFSKKPDIIYNVKYNGNNKSETAAAKDEMSVIQSFIDKVLTKNNFHANLLKAAKDCFIGKRVAWFVNVSETSQSISIDFIPALEFVADYDNANRLVKIIAFYQINNNSSEKKEQRIYKKKYWMENGLCHVVEEIYDGRGVVIETIVPEQSTKFTYIPAGVIINDGLLGDISGKSDIAELSGYEEAFSRLANADIDAERKNMNPILYSIGMTNESTQNLSIAPGSYHDYQPEALLIENGSIGQVGILEAKMGYSAALKTTLDRISAKMHNVVDVPDVDTDKLQGVITSGKGLKALYWGLIVRCDEKMLAWRPEIEKIINAVIDGALLYPGSAAAYCDEAIKPTNYFLTIENQYPLPEDEESEKQIDMSEVNSSLMSKKAYMKKWRGLDDEAADAELQQIAKERQILEDAFSVDPPIDLSGLNIQPLDGS